MYAQKVVNCLKDENRNKIVMITNEYRFILTRKKTYRKLYTLSTPGCASITPQIQLVLQCVLTFSYTTLYFAESAFLCALQFFYLSLFLYRWFDFIIKTICIFSNKKVHFYSDSLCEYIILESHLSFRPAGVFLFCAVRGKILQRSWRPWDSVKRVVLCDHLCFMLSILRFCSNRSAVTTTWHLTVSVTCTRCPVFVDRKQRAAWTRPMSIFM